MTRSGADKPMTEIAVLRGAAPEVVFDAWPEGLTVAALISGGGPNADPRRSRWSVLAIPEGAPVRSLEALGDAAEQDGVSNDTPRFGRGWIGYLSYELGRVIEPRAVGSGRAGSTTPEQSEAPSCWPVMEWFRCESALVHDAGSGKWFAKHPRARDIGEEIARRIGDGAHSRVDAAEFQIGRLRSGMGRAAYEAAVARTVEYIRAGDIFQANIAHRIAGEFVGSARGLMSGMLGRARPWYGAYLETLDEASGAARALCSISPELFLQLDGATRRVVTRPIKGTRREERSGDAGQLERSGKDTAELVMIVDLMRNDLGRVCEFGSVRVDEARAIERHAAGEDEAEAALHHGVATVSGTLRRDRSLVDLIRASFPPGSVTGAPKVRAMQIIDELEPVERGPYCGAIGFIGDDGSMTLSVGIRTALVEGRAIDPSRKGLIEGRVSYSVGAGIVAESDPRAEWDETLDKAAAFFDVARGDAIVREDWKGFGA